MARKTILICDNCGGELEEKNATVIRITPQDARKNSMVAEYCDRCVSGLKGRVVGRRGRKPKELQNA